MAKSQLGLCACFAAGAGAGRESGVVLLSAVAREKGRDDEDDGDEKCGGSIRVIPGRVWRRCRMPMRFRVGERPAGAERVGCVVWMREGDLGVSVGRVVGVVVGVNVMGVDLVRMKADGLVVVVPSLLLPLERLVKREGSMFSASMSSE
jgi:hypothetical protein